MEVDNRMHAAAFLPAATYPQHIYDSLARHYYPQSSSSTSYMPAHSQHPSLPSAPSYNAYPAQSIAGRFRGGDPSQFAGMQPSIHMNMHNHASTSGERYTSVSHMYQSPSVQHHHIPSPQLSGSATAQSLALSAPGHHHHHHSSTSTPSQSQSMQRQQSVPIMSANAARREIRRSPLTGEAERAPQAAYLYEQSRLMPSSLPLSLIPSQSWAGINPSSSSATRLPPILQVEKQQVTTSATQAASASRRRNEANFQCPVPGCGSTFTRRFNLRGMFWRLDREAPLTLYCRAFALTH
jgi:hypothetical protein